MGCLGPLQPLVSPTLAKDQGWVATRGVMRERPPRPFCAALESRVGSGQEPLDPFPGREEAGARCSGAGCSGGGVLGAGEGSCRFVATEHLCRVTDTVGNSGDGHAE